MKRLLSFYLSIIVTVIASAQELQPKATLTYKELSEEKVVEMTYEDPTSTEELSAPVSAVFYAHPVNYDGYNVNYSWTVDGVQIANPDSTLSRVFTTSGQHTVAVQASFFTKKSSEPWSDTDPITFTFTIAASVLKFPNAFSPNGDGVNDILRAKVSEKDKYVSIIDFEAAVFNRWGVKLYSWNDLDGGWDGKYNGKTVKDGVYFLVVSAHGADGQEYKIKKAINVLTTFTNVE